MRKIRRSISFADSLERLLEQGLSRFGYSVVADKKAMVDETIEGFLARHPRREADPDLGLCTYEVSCTPFVLIYDFDDDELRVHLVVHASADRRRIDLTAIEW